MLNDLVELQVFNDITFFENGHKYLIGNTPSPISVSKLIEMYKPTFDAEEMSKRTAKNVGISQEDVLKIWKDKNVFASNKGKILHFYIDNSYRNRICSFEDISKINKDFDKSDKDSLLNELKTVIKQFESFKKDHKHVLPVKNEFVLGDINDTKICGTLDMLGYNTESNQYEIYDFKTNLRFTHSSKYRKRFLPPIKHLEVCEKNIYSLQLSLYQTILEKYTNIRVSNNYAIWFFHDNDDYQKIQMSDLRKEANSLLSDFKGRSSL